MLVSPLFLSLISLSSAFLFYQTKCKNFCDAGSELYRVCLVEEKKGREKLKREKLKRNPTFLLFGRGEKERRES
jgi:hypothetical protein